MLITRTGRWKAFLVAGSILVVAGFGLLSTIDHETNMVLLGGFLFVLGVGIGMTMQNLVLAVQNTVAAADLGAASSAVAFFRSLGGTIGVSVLGAVLSSHVGDLIGRGWPASRARRPPRPAPARRSGGLQPGAAGHPDADPGLLRRRDRPDLPDLGRRGRRSPWSRSCSSTRSRCRTQSGEQRLREESRGGARAPTR